MPKQKTFVLENGDVLSISKKSIKKQGNVPANDIYVDGNRIGDIGNAIQTYAESKGLGVVRELVGHGVGSNVHEMPDVPNYGKPNTGPLLKENMVIAVEPMLNLGTKEIFMLDDDWTIVTADDMPSAHFEHTVLVTKDGYEILTKRWENAKEKC